ncbi:MAG TPA: phosphoribosylanthranilate isomerase [Thermomicrobiaceae bacterium]|nr:phosphoribosylanthranilate isomerase [Thermomicrobiaceae bacterium]
MTLVKICGVRSPESARVVAEAGADLMGLIFAPARRQVTVEAAAEIVAVLRAALSSSGGAAEETALLGAKHAPAAVGVFVDETPERMNAVAEAAGLDLIQLSGDEPPELLAQLARPALKALRLPAGTAVDAARRAAARYLEAPVPARALLLDTHVAGSYGGNGVVGDWELAAALAREFPLILAGGLKPELAPEAIARVAPLGVDVSSGVETEGDKDPARIRAFVAAARRQQTVPRYLIQSSPFRLPERVTNRAIQTQRSAT